MKRAIYKLFLGANIVVAAALLLSFLAVHVNPEVTVIPAFFGLAYPYLLLLNIIIMIIWALRLKYEAFISLAVILLGMTHLSNYIKIGKPGEDKTGTIKVMSYNVHLFNSLETKKKTSSEKKIIEFLKLQKPDVICLQELYFAGSAARKESEMKASLGSKYSSHMKILGSGNNRHTGLVTFSRYPIISRGEIIHPESASLSIYTDILINKDTVRIYNNHLQSFRLRGMDHSFIEEIAGSDNDQTLSDIKNISVSLKQGFIKRAIQAKLVKDHIGNSPFPVIVLGDFNDTPVSFAYRKLRKGLSDSFVTSGSGAGFTYKGNYPPNRIDYILYDNYFESRAFEIKKLKYSDHYPVIAYLKKKN